MARDAVCRACNLDIPALLELGWSGSPGEPDGDSLASASSKAQLPALSACSPSSFSSLASRAARTASNASSPAGSSGSPGCRTGLHGPAAALPPLAPVTSAPEAVTRGRPGGAALAQRPAAPTASMLKRALSSATQAVQGASASGRAAEGSTARLPGAGAGMTAGAPRRRVVRLSPLVSFTSGQQPAFGDSEAASGAGALAAAPSQAAGHPSAAINVRGTTGAIARGTLAPCTLGAAPAPAQPTAKRQLSDSSSPNLGSWAQRKTEFTLSPRRGAPAAAAAGAPPAAAVAGAAPAQPTLTGRLNPPLPARRGAARKPSKDGSGGAAGEAAALEVAWRRAFRRKWAREQLAARYDNYPADPRGYEDDWSEALEYLETCGPGLALQLGPAAPDDDEAPGLEGTSDSLQPPRGPVEQAAVAARRHLDSVAAKAWELAAQQCAIQQRTEADWARVRAAQPSWLQVPLPGRGLAHASRMAAVL